MPRSRRFSGAVGSSRTHRYLLLNDSSQVEDRIATTFKGKLDIDSIEGLFLLNDKRLPHPYYSGLGFALALLVKSDRDANLDDDQLARLAKILTSVKIFSISNVHAITPDGIARFVKSLSIESLNLHGYELDHEYLAGILGACPALRTLTLNNDVCVRDGHLVKPDDAQQWNSILKIYFRNRSLSMMLMLGSCPSEKARTVLSTPFYLKLVLSYADPMYCEGLRIRNRSILSEMAAEQHDSCLPVEMSSSHLPNA